MLDIIMAVMAAGMNAASPSDRGPGDGLLPPPRQESAATGTGQGADPQLVPGSAQSGQNAVAGEGTGSQTAQPANATAFDMSVVPAGLVAEPQTPSGKFTTATEVKPILNATKGNWVAVREYEGKDWLYVTHLWSWRCGLKALAISVNGETMQNWPMPPCHEQFTTPNAVLEDDGLPVLTFRSGSVRTITIQIVYDDLSMDVARFDRANVMIP